VRWLEIHKFKLNLLAMLLVCFASGPLFAVVTAVGKPWMRVPGYFNHMRLDPKGRFVAYQDDDGLGLSVLDLKTSQVYLVSEGQVGPSFAWSPDGFRLFYREQSLMPDGGVKSVINAFDCSLFKNVVIDEMSTASGYLTLDPRDLRLQILGPKGVRTQKIYFPSERLAKWQVAQRIEHGKWLATQRSMLWLTHGGITMRKLEDDGSGVESFDLAPHGDRVVWATRNGRIYLSRNGEDPKFVAYGRDPRWHPNRPLFIFSGARTVGNKIVSYDLRIADHEGAAGQYLTATQFSSERWPQWRADSDRVVYAVEQSDELYTLDLKP
jgi:hypothetical protein